MGSGELDDVPVVRSKYLGVDLFFVLSGFVIAMNYTVRPARESIVVFVTGRLFRVLPLHWFALTVMALLVALDPGAYWGPGPRSPASFVASLVLIQGWVGWSSAWNYPAWSISAEWLTYGCFIAAMYPLSRLTERGLCALLIVVCLVPLLYVVILGHPQTLNHTERAGLIRCVAEFFAGAVLYRAWRTTTATLLQRNGVFIAACLLLAAAVVLRPLEIVVPFAFLGLVAACAWNAELATASLGQRVTVFLGDISFSIYLLHTILFSSALALIHSSFLGGEPLSLRLARLGAATALLIPVSTATWRFIEVPAQGAGRVVARALQRRLMPHAGL